MSVAIQHESHDFHEVIKLLGSLCVDVEFNIFVTF